MDNSKSDHKSKGKIKKKPILRKTNPNPTNYHLLFALCALLFDKIQVIDGILSLEPGIDFA